LTNTLLGLAEDESPFNDEYWCWAARQRYQHHQSSVAKFDVRNAANFLSACTNELQEFRKCSTEIALL